MDKELITQKPDEGELVPYAPPQAVIDSAVEAAKALTRVVSQKKKPVILNDEQYLEYEDWQTLAQFFGVTAITGEAIPVDIDGVKGAKAVAKLINFKTGMIIGGAEAYCLRDEPNWKSKPWFQLASMAQTRAGAKALRNRFAWVAVLAGYRPTPAEEMEGVFETTRVVDTTEHYCLVHNTKFFKTDKMKSWAHPVEGKDEDGHTMWCNESKPKVVEVAEVVKTPQPGFTQPEGESKTTTPPADILSSMRDKGVDFTQMKVIIKK